MAICIMTAGGKTLSTEVGTIGEVGSVASACLVSRGVTSEGYYLV